MKRSYLLNNFLADRHLTEFLREIQNCQWNKEQSSQKADKQNYNQLGSQVSNQRNF